MPVLVLADAFNCPASEGPIELPQKCIDQSKQATDPTGQAGGAALDAAAAPQDHARHGGPLRL